MRGRTLQRSLRVMIAAAFVMALGQGHGLKA